jgi:cysteine synthase/rhodanese-related sulfurtransferase
MNDHTRRVYDSILGLLSGEDNPTPLVRLNRVSPFSQAQIFGKLEWYNPFGAVKDRIAANLVRDAEERGDIAPHRSRLVEPSSGNTGMGLAMIGNARGYTLRTPLSSAIPVEKRAILRFFGCEVIELDDTLCPAPGAPEGAIALATDTARNEPGFVMLNQYENQANPDGHYLTTGPEIWQQTRGKVTHFVAGLGTCGTITGTGRFLKEKNPAIQVIGVHPAEGHDIPGVRSLRQLRQTKLFSPEQYDHLVEVANHEAFGTCLRLNREESIIAGPSSGMALAGALKLVRDDPGALVVVIFPDNIFKYASSVQRHFPAMFANLKQAPAVESANGRLLKTMIENSRNPRDTIEIDDVHRLLQGDDKPLLIDLRDRVTFQKEHVVGARNIPLEELNDDDAGLPGDRTAPIVTVCSRGNISLSGLLMLKSLGYRNVRSMNGGTVGWRDRGFPVGSRDNC